ncbi:MAG: InlB B-repeat-containing protein, partial [Bacteroidales bacterium]|nr:InlB B-repeat-containing protein [Bacteroidales bacterium]
MNDHFITRLVAVLMIAAVAFTGCKKNDPDEKPTCTVTFDSTGGSAVDAQTIETGTPAKAPANPVRDGYEFLYWTLNGEQYVFSKPVTGNITLTAKWQEITADTEYWQVQWSLGGGAWPEGDNHETRTVKGGTLAEPNAPVKEGSTFEGWYKEAAL